MDGRGKSQSKRILTRSKLQHLFGGIDDIAHVRSEVDGASVGWIGSNSAFKAKAIERRVIWFVLLRVENGLWSQLLVGIQVSER